MTINSKEYWENRYKSNLTSGPGSYGILCDYKSNMINNFIINNNIKSIIDFGCGDGNQINNIICEKYYGLDISETIINKCRKIFINDKNKIFDIYDNYNNSKHDLSLSLDVIYHLIENNIFEDYMFNLFNSSNKFVIIYSSNGENIDIFSEHIIDRNFTSWVDINIKDFKIIQKINNPFKYNLENKDVINTSISDFYIFKKIKTK